jgi:hypothetical protein
MKLIISILVEKVPGFCLVQLLNPIMQIFIKSALNPVVQIFIRSADISNLVLNELGWNGAKRLKEHLLLLTLVISLTLLNVLQICVLEHLIYLLHV